MDIPTQRDKDITFDQFISIVEKECAGTVWTYGHDRIIAFALEYAKSTSNQRLLQILCNRCDLPSNITFDTIPRLIEYIKSHDAERLARETSEFYKKKRTALRFRYPSANETKLLEHAEYQVRREVLWKRRKDAFLSYFGIIKRALLSFVSLLFSIRVLVTIAVRGLSSVPDTAKFRVMVALYRMTCLLPAHYCRTIDEQYLRLGKKSDYTTNSEIIELTLKYSWNMITRNPLFRPALIFAAICFVIFFAVTGSLVLGLWSTGFLHLGSDQIFTCHGAGDNRMCTITNIPASLRGSAASPPNNIDTIWNTPLYRDVQYDADGAPALISVTSIIHAMQSIRPPNGCVVASNVGVFVNIVIASDGRTLINPCVSRISTARPHNLVIANGETVTFTGQPGAVLREGTGTVHTATDDAAFCVLWSAVRAFGTPNRAYCTA